MTRTSQQHPNPLVAIAALAGAVIGIPALLIAAIGWPLPHAVPATGDVARAVRDGYLPDDFIINALAVAMWAVWATFTVCIVLEAVATWRGRPARRLPLAGLLQPAAARLVGAVTVLAILGGSRVTPMPPLSAQPEVPADIVLIASRDTAPLAATPALLVDAPAAPPSPTYIVRPRDDLWSIAERHLGDGYRWKEVFALNRDRPLPPAGEFLRDPNLIRPGWHLELPVDAVGLTPEQPAPPPPPAEHAGPAEQTTDPVDAPEAPGVEQGQGHSATVVEGRDDPSGTDVGDLAPALAVGLGAMVAGGVLWRIDRDRRTRRRLRRPGDPIRRPPTALEPHEHHLRSIGAQEAVGWVDSVNRHLRSVLAAMAGEERPAVVAVRVGDRGVEVLLDRAASAPATFVGEDEGRTWRLDPDVSLEVLAELGAGQPPACPALVTIGGTAEGPVLVDLEHLGQLTVRGDPHKTEQFLRGLTIELATAPWAEDVRVSAIGAGGVQVPGVAVSDDAEGMAASIAGAGKHARDLLGEMSVRVARLAADGDPWSLTVAVAWRPEDTGLLQASAQPGGPALVVGHGDHGAHCLTVGADGQAHLDPIGLTVHAAGIDDKTLDCAAAMLFGDGTVIDLRDAGAEEPDRSSSLGNQTTAAAELSDGPQVRVRVLGAVEVSGWHTDPDRPKAIELVTFLACHRQPVHEDRIRTALWAGEVTSATFKSAISRARRWLGADSRGEDHIPTTDDGRYHVGPGVACDWHQFERLVRQSAATDDDDRSVEHLRSALELVRGAPFDDVLPRTYTWAWSEQLVSAIEVAVCDAAMHLGEIALGRDDAATAAWAATKGLLVCPGHEGLYQVRMRAASAADDLDGLDQAYREAERAARADDPLDDVQPQTRQLYDQLRARRPAGTSSATPPG